MKIIKIILFGIITHGSVCVWGNEIYLKKEIEITNSFGKESNPFLYPSEVDVDSSGNIYILESNEKRIQVFDKNGNYKKVIGRKGQGPGEFQTPIYICVSNKDKLYVADITRRCISIFRKDMEYLKTIYFPNEILLFKRFMVDKDENIICGYASYNEELNRYVIAKYDNNFKYINTIMEYIGIYSIIRLKGITIQPFKYSAQVLWTLSEDGFIYSIRNDENVLLKIDTGGGIRKKEEINYDLEKMDKEEIEGIFKGFKKDIRNITPDKYIPKHKPAIINMIAIDRYILLLKQKENDKKYEYDLYNEEMKRIGNVNTLYIINRYKYGKVYSIEIELNKEKDDVENVKIARYGILE